MTTIGKLEKKKPMTSRRACTAKRNVTGPNSSPMTHSQIICGRPT